MAAPPPTNSRARVAVVGFVALLVLAAAGGYATGKPQAGSTAQSDPAPRVSVVPPPGRTLYFARLDEFPSDQAESLVDYFRARYGVEATMLPPAALGPAVWDGQRHQIVAETAITAIKELHADVARDADAVIIGLIGADLYIRKRSDWRWAFGFRGQGASDNRRLAIVSTARMAWPRGRAGDDITSVRLRKMVSRYIGLMYFGLPLSKDPRSVLYDDVGGVDDLDRMGEDF